MAAGFVSVMQVTTHQNFHLYMMNDTVTMSEVIVSYRHRYIYRVEVVAIRQQFFCNP